MACDKIPEEPSKPNYLFEYDYHEQAKAELGFDDKDFRTRPERGQTPENQKRKAKTRPKALSLLPYSFPVMIWMLKSHCPA